MAVRRLAEVQPDSFAFTPENEAWCEAIIKKYPSGRQASAVISLLWRAQQQHDGWLPRPAIEKVAEILGMPDIRVLEIATFYSMFNLSPVGKFFVQLCGTTPCQLAGSDAIKAILKSRVGEAGTVTADGIFSWTEVECLGACCNAPMVQINDDYFEDLTPENFVQLLDDLAAGNAVRVGSQTGRVSSEPFGGLTSLISCYGADGDSGPFSVKNTPSPSEPATEVEHPAQEPAAQEPAVPDLEPAEPEFARLAQEGAQSTATPRRTIRKGRKWTGVAVSKPGKNAEAAAQKDAARAAGAYKGGPSTPPGAEPDDSDPQTS